MKLAMALSPLAVALLFLQDRGSGGEPLQRGAYIVNEVAMCVQCHTPRTPSGELIRQRLLQGAPVPLESPWAGRRWAIRAPHIAGLPGFSGPDMVHLLTTGSRPDGRKPDPPMPSFRLTKQDAEAVVAYLRSLK
jgi:mono/diheme cytochrome c family protein